MQVAWLSYGASVGGVSRLTPMRSADLDWVADDDSSAPVFVEALDRGLGVLERWRPKASDFRKVLLVLSDGRDESDDRQAITALGERAAKSGIRIHSLAFSPSDTRRPLLSLGELSRKSGGTFRWIRTPTAQAIRDQVKRVRDELYGQFVLVGLAPTDKLTNRPVQITAQLGGETLTANEHVTTRALCGGLACSGRCIDALCRAVSETRRSIYRIWPVFAAVGALAFAFVIGWVSLRRRRSQAALEFIAGPRRGERIAVGRRLTVGSHPIANCVIDDARLAPHHATIERRGGSYYVVDGGSAQGVLLNGRRVAHETALANGVVIRIGSTELRFIAE